MSEMYKDIENSILKVKIKYPKVGTYFTKLMKMMMNTTLVYL
jgi:hypothetical protein